jgi:hypothetical protein
MAYGQPLLSLWRWILIHRYICTWICWVSSYILYEPTVDCLYSRRWNFQHPPRAMIVRVNNDLCLLFISMSRFNQIRRDGLGSDWESRLAWSSCMVSSTSIIPASYQVTSKFNATRFRLVMTTIKCSTKILPPPPHTEATVTGKIAFQYVGSCQTEGAVIRWKKIYLLYDLLRWGSGILLFIWWGRTNFNKTRLQEFCMRTSIAVQCAIWTSLAGSLRLMTTGFLISKRCLYSWIESQISFLLWLDGGGILGLKPSSGTY